MLWFKCNFYGKSTCGLRLGRLDSRAYVWSCKWVVNFTQLACQLKISGLPNSLILRKLSNHQRATSHVRCIIRSCNSGATKTGASENHEFIYTQYAKPFSIMFKYIFFQIHSPRFCQFKNIRFARVCCFSTGDLWNNNILFRFNQNIRTIFLSLSPLLF